MFRYRGIALTIVFFFLSQLAVLFALLEAGDRKSGQMLVLFSPWTNPGMCLQQVLAAGGRPIASGAYGCLLSVAAKEPEFGERVRAEGAWLVLKAPNGMGCFSKG